MAAQLHRSQGKLKILFPIRKKVFGKIWIFGVFFQKSFEKSQFNPAGLIRLFSNGLNHLNNPERNPRPAQRDLLLLLNQNEGDGHKGKMFRGISTMVRICRKSYFYWLNLSETLVNRSNFDTFPRVSERSERSKRGAGRESGALRSE